MSLTIFYDRNYEGAWVLTALVGNYYETQRYYGYTKKQATQLFRQQLKEKKA